jgi:hypothetical protein
MRDNGSVVPDWLPPFLAAVLIILLLNLALVAQGRLARRRSWDVQLMRELRALGWSTTRGARLASEAFPLRAVPGCAEHPVLGLLIDWEAGLLPGVHAALEVLDLVTGSL